MNDKYVLDLRWHGKLPENLGKTFDKIAYLIRSEFNVFIEKVSRPLSDNLDWWIEGPASRNIYSSPLFHYCCSLVLLEELEIQNKIPKSILVDSRALHNIISTWIREKGIKVEVIQLAKINESITKKCFGRFLRPIKSSFTMILLYLATRKNLENKKNNLFNQPLILIDIPILDGFEVKDRCYPGFWENLGPAEKKRTYFVPEIDIKSISKLFNTLNKLRDSNKNYIIKWEFLSFKDYIFAINHYLRIRKVPVPECYFRVFQLKYLIYEELYSGLNFGMAMIALLNYRFFQKIKQLGIRIETSINWFENQGMDKGWNRGLHDFFPEAIKKGYLGMIISKHYLPMFPTIAEAKANVLPDTLLVVGTGLKEQMKEFYPDLSVKTAPAFRFQGVYGTFLKHNPSKYISVLVALYSILEEAVTTLNFVFETSILCEKDISIKWNIKPHPLTDKHKLTGLTNHPFPDNWTWMDGDFHESLDKVDILIGSASSTCLEAIARGRFVLLIGNQHGLTHNSIPSTIPKDLWQLSYTYKDAAKAIKSYSNNNIRLINHNIRANFFEPVTSDNVNNLVKL